MATFRLLLVATCLHALGACKIFDTDADGPTSVAPVAVNSSIAAPPTGTVTGTLSVSSSGNTPMVFSLVSNGHVGVASLIDAQSGTFHYVTDHANVGFDSFSFSVTQGAFKSNVATVQVAITDGGVAGKLTYDFVPTVINSDSTSYLNYANTQQKPIRNAQVRLLDANDPTSVLAQTDSDEEGHYIFAKTSVTTLMVAVVCAMDAPAFQVLDNTQNGASYVLLSKSVDTTQTLVNDMHAASGWDGRSYSTLRSAAPFAILDVVYTAAQAFAKERPQVAFAPLTIYWSTRNRSEVGDASAGQITTSHWDGHALYILGAAEIDTDEYDTHVVAHEWGHYFEFTQSRSDSPGGEHGPGDVLDMRVAFSEGWGNSESAMSLYPDTVYSDTQGAGQAAGFSFDLQNSDAWDATPGWYSEVSVQSILYDLFSPPDASRPWDTVALGLGPIYDVMVGPHKGSLGFTSIFSFIHGLKTLHPELSDGIDAIVGRRSLDRIDDDFGSGQSQNGGVTGALPVYDSVTLGASIPITLSTVEADGMDVAGYNFNKLGANRYIHWVGDGQPINITATSKAEVDLYVFSPTVANSVASSSATCASPPHCSQTLSHYPTHQGADYLINAQAWDANKEQFICNLIISH